MKMERRFPKLAKRLATIALLGGLAAAVAACDDQSTKSSSAAEHLEQARDHLTDGNPRASVIEIKNALQQDPENGAARMMLGEVYLDLRNPLAAEKEFLRAKSFGIPTEKVNVQLGHVWLMQGKFDQVLKDVVLDESAPSPDKARILVLRGNANHALGRHDEAGESYQRALSEQPDMLDALLGLGSLALASNDLEGARARLEQLQEIAPDDYRTTSLKAEIAMAEGDYAAAEAAFQTILDARPHDLRAEVQLAWAQIQNNKSEAAIEHLDKLTKSMGGNAQIQFMRALAAYTTEDHQAAKQYAEQALAIEPNHPQSLFIAGASAYSLNQLQSSNRHLTKLVFRLPGHQLARRILAATQLKLGMADRAVTTLGNLEPLNRADAVLFTAVAEAAMRSGDFKAGENIFEQVAAMQAGRAEARAELGLSRIAVGDIEDGISELEEALRLDPKLEKAGLALVMSYLRLKEYGKALTEARAVQRELPDSPHAYTLEGLVLAGSGDLAGAETAFNKAWTISPGDVNAGNNLAAYALLQDQVDEARAIYATVLEHNPENLRTLVSLGALEIREGDSDQAAKAFERAVDQHPNAPRPRVLLASVYLDQGQAEKALEATDGLAKQHPTDSALFEVRGLANFDRGALGDAAEDFKELVALEPELPSARFYLAHTQERLGWVTLARRHADRLMELAPEHVDGKFMQARLAANAGDFEFAQARLEELKVDYPSDPNLLELEGSIALARNEPQKAIELYQQALEGKRTTFLTLRLARAQSQAGQGDASLATLETWTEEVPDDVLARMTLGGGYLERGRLSDAQAQFAAVVERSPNNPLALNNLAWTMSELGDLDGALRHGEKARSLAPSDPDILDTVGVIYLKKGQSDEALPLLRKAADLAEDDPNIAFHLAQALVDSGKRKDATDLLRVLLAQNPSFAERGDAQALLNELDG